MIEHTYSKIIICHNKQRLYSLLEEFGQLTDLVSKVENYFLWICQC